MKQVLILRNAISENIKDPFVKEQYKLIIDSAHRMSDRSKDSNIIYVTISSIFISYLANFPGNKTIDTRSTIIFGALIMIGIVICFNWISVVKSYEKINQLNQLIINAFEDHFPTNAFSVRSELSESEPEKGNLILHREKFIPYMFIMVYMMIYLINILI